MNQTQSLIFTPAEAAPSRMGGATGAAEPMTSSPRPSLLDRLIEERRRGDCAEPRRARVAATVPAAVPVPDVSAPTEGERSLDDLVSTTWDALATTETAACFVCGGDLLPRFGAGARPVGGRCTDCGSELS